MRPALKGNSLGGATKTGRSVPKKNDGFGGPGRRGSKDAPYIMLLVSYADFGSRRMSMMPESAI